MSQTANCSSVPSSDDLAEVGDIVVAKRHFRNLMAFTERQARRYLSGYLVAVALCTICFVLMTAVAYRRWRSTPGDFTPQLQPDDFIHQFQRFGTNVYPSDWKLSSMEFEDGLPEWIHDYIRFHNSPDTSETKYLIWACTADQGCGGIGDRARGIVSAFYLALVTRRKLLIYNPIPLDIKESLQPALIDWTRDAQARYEHADHQTVWFCEIKDDLYHFFDGQYDVHRSIVLRANMFVWPLLMNCQRYADHLRQLKIPSGIWTEGYEEILFTWAWKALMRPSRKLQADLFALRQSTGLTGDFIAVHIRRGGHWGDPDRHNNLQQFADCLTNMTKVVGSLPVYVATDDLDTRRRFADLNPASSVRYDTTEPYHVELSRKLDKTPQILRTWAEFFLFTEASCVVTSRSGFSEWPVAISRHPLFGSRCHARFDYCSIETINKSRSELVSLPIWPDSYPDDRLSGAVI